MTAPNSFGALLKYYRLAAGLSQDALAANAGLSARTISDLERSIHSAPRTATLTLLIDALTLTPPQRSLLISLARPADINAPARPSGIPHPPTSLLGREQERSQSLAFLRHSDRNLLTLTGPSGVGKTRLAVQLANDLVADFALVVYVPLAPIRDATLVPQAVAQALGIQEVAAFSITQQVQACLQTRATLLVLDNAEQVLDAAPFVSDLLAQCPRLTILVTSRIPLRLRAEQELLVAPLPSADAVKLFCERAQAIRPARAYPAAAVAAICARLDDLPLAIELAAMQVRTLSLPELYEGLTHRLTLLRNGAPDLPKRQQTMEHAIAWSYDLLTAEQQRCFRALGVFVGGWGREAAEALCWGGEQFTEADRILILASLVDASLIHAELAPDGTMRFGMLELLRDYALQQLRLAGEEDRYRRRHAAYYATIAEEVMAHFGPEQGSRDVNFTRTVAHELPNARAALEWAATHCDAELGLRLTGFARLWHVCGQMAEAEFWLARMLTLDQQARAQSQPTAPLKQRIALLAGFGRTIVRHGRSDGAAAAYAQEALELAQSISDQDGMSDAYETLGMIAQMNGLLVEAHHAFNACYANAQGGLISRALAHLAELAWLQGDLPRATALAHAGLARAQTVGSTWDVAFLCALLGHLASQQRQYATAKAHYRTALTLYRAFASPTYLAACLEGVAAVAAAEGQVRQAIRMYAVTASLREQAQIALPPQAQDDFGNRIAMIKNVLDHATFAREWETGRNFSQAEAIDDALADHITNGRDDLPVAVFPT